MSEEQIKELLHQHHVKIGSMGGSKIRDLKGSAASEYYRLLGKRSGEAKREKKRLERLSTYQFDSKTSKSYNDTNSVKS